MVSSGGILSSMRSSRLDLKTERQLGGTIRGYARFRGVQHNQMRLLQKRLVGAQLTLTPLQYLSLPCTDLLGYVRLRNRRLLR